MMHEINWAERALHSEIEYSRALGSKPTEYPDFIHLYNEAVPWGGDFNCAVGVKIADFRSFERVVQQMEQIHREKGLDRPDRYDIYPPLLDEGLWRDHLGEKGYRLQRSIWFCAPTLDGELPAGCALYSPSEDEYIEWYHDRQRSKDYYDEERFDRLRPLQQSFARVFRPYWLCRDGRRVGWVYCARLGEYGSLFDVWIEPAFRGQGLGRTLVDAIRLEGRKHGARHILLRTSEQRREFYEKCGFWECLKSSTVRLKAGWGTTVS